MENKDIYERIKEIENQLSDLKKDCQLKNNDFYALPEIPHSFKVGNREELKKYLVDILGMDIRITKMLPIACGTFVFIGRLKTEHHIDKWGNKVLELVQKPIYLESRELILETKGGYVRIRTHGNSIDKVLGLYDLIVENYNIDEQNGITLNF